MKTHEGIEKACKGILRKNKSQNYFDFEIHNEPVITLKNKRRGRTLKNGDEKVAVTTNHFSVKLIFHQEQFDKPLGRCGYYLLITNKNDIAFEEAMQSHKDPYKNEHTHRKAKSSLNLEPIYLPQKHFWPSSRILSKELSKSSNSGVDNASETCLASRSLTAESQSPDRHYKEIIFIDKMNHDV